MVSKLLSKESEAGLAEDERMKGCGCGLELLLSRIVVGSSCTFSLHSILTLEKPLNWTSRLGLAFELLGKLFRAAKIVNRLLHFPLLTYLGTYVGTLFHFSLPPSTFLLIPLYQHCTRLSVSTFSIFQMPPVSIFPSFPLKSQLQQSNRSPQPSVPTFARAAL